MGLTTIQLQNTSANIELQEIFRRHHLQLNFTFIIPPGGIHVIIAGLQTYHNNNKAETITLYVLLICLASVLSFYAVLLYYTDSDITDKIFTSAFQVKTTSTYIHAHIPYTA